MRFGIRKPGGGSSLRGGDSFRGSVGPADHPLTGSTTITTSASATRLTMAHPLTGTTTITTSLTGDLGSPHPLTGTTTITTSAEATRLTMAHPLTGTTTITLTPAGSLAQLAHSLTGTTTITTSTAGVIRLTDDPTGVYEVRVVNRTTHALIATLTNANVETVEMVLNEPWSAQFTMHPLDPDTAHLTPALLATREVQIWRDGRCIFWGIAIDSRARVDSQTATITYSCVGLLWYYQRRYFGPLQNNYLANPDFESGLTSWTGVNTTATVSTTWRALGAQSVKLVQTSADQDGYLRQRYTTTTTTVPVFFAVKALCHISGTGWVGPALGERGLYVEQQSTPGGAAVGEVYWEPINEDTPRDHDKPVRLETGITIPAGVTRTIEVRLYSPGGTIWWDATALVVEESVGSQVTGDPAGTIISRVHNYSQDASQGKSNEDIGVDGAPGTYPTLVRIYQFFDAGNIFDALSEYPRIGAADFEIEWPPLTAASRKLMVYPVSKGSHKAGSPLTLGSNLTGLDYDVQGSAITTSARVLGMGDGADREEGLAVDTSSLDGLVLESVAHAPYETPIDGLQRVADEDLADSKAAVKVPSFTLPANYVIPGIALGDTVPVTVDFGPALQESGNRRVVRIRLDATKDEATVGVN